LKFGPKGPDLNHWGPSVLLDSITSQELLQFFYFKVLHQGLSVLGNCCHLLSLKNGKMEVLAISNNFRARFERNPFSRSKDFKDLLLQSLAITPQSVLTQQDLGNRYCDKIYSLKPIAIVDICAIDLKTTRPADQKI
jgi:hypothetical protein